MSEPARPDQHPPGTLRIGSIAGIDVLVRSSWLFIAALIAFAMGPRIEAAAPGLGALAYLGGLAFAVLLYLSILLHEAAHAVAALRFGLEVKSISIHFMGGATELGEESENPKQEFVIAVVGPLTSIAVGAALWLLASVTGASGLPGLTLDALAWVNLVLGAMNLFPGFPLDGGRVLRAGVWKITGRLTTGTIAAGWGGRVGAILCLGWPAVQQGVFDSPPSITDFVMAGLVAAFLWTAAGAALEHARLRSRLPSIDARSLARPLLVVPEDLPVAEAVRRAREANVGGIATQTSDERVTGIVDEVALSRVPEQQRPWVQVSSVARRMEDGLWIAADADGESMLKSITQTPASEYLLREADGRVLGLLNVKDLERALAQGL